MSVIQVLLFMLQILHLLSSSHSQSTDFSKHAKIHALFSDKDDQSMTFSRRLSEPLIGEEDGRVYACSENYFYAFESNGSVAWTLLLNYTCNIHMPPIHGGTGKIFLVAENRVLQIKFSSIRSGEPVAEVVIGVEGQEVIGISVSTISSSVFINIKNRGLFAYTMNGQLLWSAGPVLSQFGYRQGCRKNSTSCFFTSVPMIDHCEASIYISNSEGELYSLSSHSPYFKWIQDLSPFDKSFTVTPGNNGRLYVTVPARDLVLALDVSSGNLLWQGSIGPLSSPDCAPVVDSNGWISIGSLDGFLYSFSPDGMLKKFSKVAAMDSLIQVGPTLDCSGYGAYISQTEMEEKISRVIGEYTYVSAQRPKSVTFTLLVPSTGSIYWSESYPGQLPSLLSRSDLHHFLLDEKIILAFLAASKSGNPLACRSRHQKLASSCSQARLKPLSIYTGNERAILLFLLFQSAVLIGLAALVRFCCIFWSKKKIQGRSLGSFLQKRRALQLKKKAFERTITELKQKATEEPTTSETLEKLGTLIREKEGIERKLSTTYSLGRDRAGWTSKSLLPTHDGKARSYSFRSGRKESVTIFHTQTDTSSSRESIDPGEESSDFDEGKQLVSKLKGKAKAPIEIETSSTEDGSSFEGDYWESPSEAVASSSKGLVKSVFGEGKGRERNLNDAGKVEAALSGSGRVWLKRRKAMSSTN